MSGDGTTGVDGRHRRSQRSREAVVRATVELLEAGEAHPTPEVIATRAGLSARTVFRLFEDLDGLYLEAIRQRAQETAELYLPPPPGRSTAERVTSMVLQRRRLHEAISPTRRFAGPMERQVATLAAIFSEVRAVMRRQVADHFAEELAAAGDSAGEVLDALDVALSWEAWDYLRGALGASADRAEAALARTVRALVTP